MLGDGFAGIDLDKCRNRETEEVEKWAQEILEAIQSYAEVSPSGTGIHILLKGRLPLNGRRRTNQIEMYDSGRYFTVTGQTLGKPIIEERHAELKRLYQRIFKINGKDRPITGGPSSRNETDDEEKTEDQELVKRAMNASNRGKFARQWHGDWTDYPSQSEADLALCSMLTFWTPSDAKQIDRLFRQSGLMRDKWERSDYRDMTIRRAIDAKNGKGPGREEPDLLSQGFHDSGNAQRLVELFGHDLRYCPEYKKWLVWSGRRWTIDQVGEIKKKAKAAMAAFLGQAIRADHEGAEKFAKASLNAYRIKALCDLAEPEMAIRAEELDRHPFLLNVMNGTIELDNGRLREHRREDYLTKLVHFNYRPEAKCDRFIGFINEVMGASLESSEAELRRTDLLVGYLQKSFGYAGTGSVREKVVFCFFGNGNNGKTTLLEAVRHVLSEYSQQILIDTLMTHFQRETNASLADLADLKGTRRFVSTSEGEEDSDLPSGS